MKDSWVTETLIQEATLAMELPASPANQFTATDSNSEDQNLTSRLPNKELAHSDNLEQSKHKKGCDSQNSENSLMAPTIVPPIQTQPMDISDTVDCNEDEEQIVPQSISSCKVSRPNSSEMTFVEEQTETVSSRIMKMGLKDLLDHDGINKSDKSKSAELNEFTTYQQKKKMAASWLGSSQNHHTIFGPLSRPSTLPSDNHNSIPKSQVKEREGSPVITHKKFDYQKKLTLHGTSTTSSPLNLSKRSPSPNFKSETTINTPVDSSPIDLTKGKKQNENVQCTSFQDPVYKYEHSTKTSQVYRQNSAFRSHVLFGIKPEIDQYTAPRIPSFWLPRSSSCSPGSASDHSMSSTTSSTEQKSEPESFDIKPSPEMLSHLHVNSAPSLLSRIDQDVPTMPRIVPFDPSRLGNFYIQQFEAANLKGGFYPLPLSHFGGYATANVSPTQPTSPSSKNRSQKQDKMFICQECGAVFKHRHHVVRHMRSHSGERPFRCEECGATFARKCILTNHKRTHTGEKPYICTECGDTFSRKHHLVIHRRTHTGEKPYKCLHCGAAFARSHHLNRHRKTHVKIDEQQQGEINRMYFAQMPSGLPLQGIQGLPTMLPLLPSNLLPTAMPSSSTPELSKQSRRDSSDQKEDGCEQGTCQINAEVEKSAYDQLGANKPEHLQCQALSE